MFRYAGRVNAGVRDWKCVPRFPIRLRSVRLTTKDIFGTLCGREPISRCDNRECSDGTLKILECNALLADKLLADEFSRDFQAGFRLARQCLGSPKPSVGWTYRTSDRQDFP